jgi:hypothetical protein
MEWKWTKGEPYERSRRIFKEQTQDKDKDTQDKDTARFNEEIANSAYSTALNHDENTWDILNQSLSGNGFKVSNKREELDFKIADRDLVQQRGNNPFLSDTNYVNDVSVRDQFLKPINTAGDRVKNTDSTK